MKKFIQSFILSIEIMGGFGDITEISSSTSIPHPKLGTSVKKHPFLGESPDVQMKPFVGNEEEKGFSLRLQHTP